MFKPLVLCSLLGIVALAVLAQPIALTSERNPISGKDAALVTEAHERRIALRAALIAQREANRQLDNLQTEEHQLNDKERAELREQLRQQRRP
jgi:hypothetical protein